MTVGKHQVGGTHRVWAAFALMAMSSLAGRGVGAAELQTQASGVFLNAAGDVLTARHAVADCESLFLVKDGRIAEARIRALSERSDLAVLRSALQPYLNATLPRTDLDSLNGIGVFAESYESLQRLPDRHRVVSNAMTIPGRGDLQLLSDVKPGASGSAVLGSGGLLIGIVTGRAAFGPSSDAGVVALSKAASSRPRHGVTRVRAVPLREIKLFLLDNQIPFQQSDAAQLGPLQSPAARAATLAVGVICG
ncbi:trypsin-like peptidase domain-containing protein [Steroidobacter sp. S1-65]|uniref:Trypsin-like peptidase domain-containing protein n=1 Tax=Steroidobacter gossypii TaxID=2805490 RepID=A0ABS1WZD3_9GAMM|nr:serine protease [Steroidobacter gossypii]MBM0106350.1 trypsin-like peptidase domain-containing protein [Steroidobacter gossypii]